MITIYNLQFNANQNNRFHTAKERVDFNVDGEWLFLLRGSYNATDILPVSIFIDNTRNDETVRIRAGDFELDKFVPAYGQAQITIRGYQDLTLYSVAGIVNVEFTDEPLPEQLFQRTDTNRMVIEVAELYANQGDLVTIDLLGQFETAGLSPLAANNTTTYFPASNNYPVSAAQMDTGSDYFKHLESFDGTLKLSLSGTYPTLVFRRHNMTVNQSANVTLINAANNQVDFCETLNAYLIKVGAGDASDSGRVFRVQKNNLAVSTLMTGPNLFFLGFNYGRTGLILADGPNTGTFKIFAQRTGITTQLFRLNVSAAGAIQSVDGPMTIPANAFSYTTAKTLPSGAFKFDNGNVLVSMVKPGLASIYLLLTDAFTEINRFTFTSVSFPTIGEPCMHTRRPIMCGTYALFCYQTAAAPSTLRCRFIQDNGSTVDTVISTGATTNFNVFVRDNDDIIFLYEETGVFAFAIYDKFGTLKTKETAASPGGNVLYRSFIFRDYIVGFNGNGSDSAFVVSLAFNTVGSMPYTDTPSTADYQFSFGDSLIAFNSTTKNECIFSVPRTVFGVCRSENTVATTGQFKVNQYIPGITNFDYTANTPGGNKGQLINNIAILNGIQ